MFGIILTILVQIKALDNGLGKVPPMGWNTWNKFACNINETLIRQTADALVSQGFKSAGYVYLNIDDCWAKSRDGQGQIQEDPITFPSGMLNLSRYIHSKGLLFGIYSDAGFKTCAGRPGSLFHEQSDADSYARWEVDYLKYDNCFSDYAIFNQYRYTRMRDALNKTGRPIYYSMCQWGFRYPWQWAQPIANSWRIQQDIKPIWIWIELIIEQLLQLSPIGQPGGWNDPDMLEVGIGKLTEDQEKSHFAIWAITKSPLIFGSDLNNLRESSKRILLNKQIIALNQDPLGIPGKLVPLKNIWLRTVFMPLSNGDLAVLLYNRSSRKRIAKYSFVEVGWQPDSAYLRDLYQKKNIGKYNHYFECDLNPHSVMVLRMSEHI